VRAKGGDTLRPRGVCVGYGHGNAVMAGAREELGLGGRGGIRIREDREEGAQIPEKA
jgi:hypothetical protein